MGVCDDDKIIPTSADAVLHIGSEEDSETDSIHVERACPAYEEEEFAYTPKLAPLWKGGEATYLRYLRTLELRKMRADHLVKETPQPSLTAGMMAGRIRGGRASQWPSVWKILIVGFW